MGLVDDRLPDWLHGLSLDTSGQDISTTREVVSAIAKSATLENVVLLVEYAHDFGGNQGVDSGDHAAAAFSVVRDAARTVDEAWVSDTGSLFSRRLTAAALIQILLEDAQGVGMSVALAATAATLIGGVPEVPELKPVADRRIAEVADSVRELPKRPKSTVREALDRELQKQTLPSKPAEGQSAAQVNSKQLREHLVAMRTAIRSAADEADAHMTSTADRMHLLLEEVEMLWWAMEPRGRDFSPWPDGYASISLTGVELARRMSVDPPLRGTGGLIRRALEIGGVNPAEELTLRDVVDSAPEGLLGDGVGADRGSSWSRPVLSALRERRSVGSDGWPGALEGRTGVSPTLAASAEDWALRLVRDFSLDRILHP